MKAERENDMRKATEAHYGQTFTDQEWAAMLAAFVLQEKAHALETQLAAKP